MGDINWSTFAAIVSAIAAIVSAGIAVVARREMKKEHEANERLARELHQSQQLFAQRATFFELWHYINDLHDIDPEQPVWPDIVRAMNALELTGVCYEAEIVDPALIRRTFSDTCLRLFDAISRCRVMPGDARGRDGAALIRENPAANRLYDELKRERTYGAAVPALGGKKRGED